MNRSENINEIVTALSKAQGEFPILQKRTKAYNYMYADLAEICECIQEPLMNHGLSIVHQTDGEYITSTLFHSSGQWISTKLKVLYKADGKVNEMQAMGSALTYCKRYSISSLLNLAADKESDDDGEKASPKKQIEVPKKEISSMSIIQLAELITTHIPLSDDSHVLDYLNNVQSKISPDKSMEWVVKKWIENPDKFLEHYEKFCDFNKEGEN